MLPLKTLEDLIEANRRLREEIELLRADIIALNELMKFKKSDNLTDKLYDRQ